MSEYLSRDAVMQKFADHIRRSNNSDFAPTPTWNQAVQIVEDTPAADVVEVQQGRWKGAGMGDYYCSLCQQLMGERTNYCPNCGAKMDRGDNDGIN